MTKFTPIKAVLIITLLVAMLLMTGCTRLLFERDGKYVISPAKAIRLSDDPGVVIVDARVRLAYTRGHFKGAINISRGDIVIHEPVRNMLLPQNQFEELMSRKGIANDSLVIIYDDGSSMDAARLWWTLRVFGHTNARVVSGGLLALLEAGAVRTTDAPVITPTEFIAQPANRNLIADIDEVLAQVNNPDKKTIILDTRTREEFDAGRVPGAVLINHLDNFFYDDTIKSVQAIKLMYRRRGIRENDTIILYCTAGIRSALTFLALHNAGYKNLKLFDGSWLQWVAAGLPTELPVVVEEVRPVPVPVPAPG